MRKTFTLLLLTAFAALAQFKISQYPNTNNLASNQLFVVTAGGTNMNIAFGQLRLITGTNLYEVSSISSYFVTNINNYSFTTNQTIYETNIVNNQFVTNQTIYQSNIVNNQFVTNQTIYETNIVNNQFTTNLTVYQTNINNYLITTNLFVTDTNITSWTITTNITVVNNITSKNAYITNLYVDNPFMGIQQLTNVAITNASDGNVLAWNDAMKKWTNTTAGSGVTNLQTSLVETNIAYETNVVIDASNAQNLYTMTNVMTNHMTLRLTNWVTPQSISVIVQGSLSYTNFKIYVIPDTRAPMRWLTLTNGEFLAVTSNQWAMLDFMAIKTAGNTTNVMSSYKETYQ